ncbi:hypothetical protein PCYB_111670 [Plasmodium cynomolgi strain B]|uniref:Reticulon domain-containing protein n=1 Tax=Plasmodium cynomolgi (strain B) TaxID=1120755 RepID=K6UDT2_PLACD|nr:hypothetical protein PCYB_111670 [Plasmodium cynomolgi strain B]GAB67146.1 hypothetical protein PCYB_111670 [Plasmodium cynomolgi strain B]
MNLNSKNIVNLSIFASINALYILLYIFNQTFLQVSDYKESDKLEIVSKEMIESCIMYIYELINDKLTLVRKYLLWTNRMENVTLIIVIYSVGNFLSFVNFSVLFYMVTWAIFLYNHINNVYITKICELAYPYYVDLRDQAKYMFDNIPKLKHIKKTI